MPPVPPGTLRWWIIRLAIEVVYIYDWAVVIARFSLYCLVYYLVKAFRHDFQGGWWRAEMFLKL